MLSEDVSKTIIKLSLDREACRMLDELASERRRGEYIAGLIRVAYQAQENEEKFTKTVEQIRRLLDGLAAN